MVDTNPFHAAPHSNVPTATPLERRCQTETVSFDIWNVCSIMDSFFTLPLIDLSGRFVQVTFKIILVPTKQDALMKTREAQALGQSISIQLQANRPDQAFALLAPILAKRTPFAMLRRIGAEIGQNPLERVDSLLVRIASAKTEGGWPLIGGVLAAQLTMDLSASLDRCQSFIRGADIWHAADTLGEWVVGQALVDHFQSTLDLLRPWREDPNVWIRRAVGTSVHYWAKRSRGAEELIPQTKTLLSFLEPLFEEQEMVAVKGIGWGLKTLGKHYPDLLSSWLERQVVKGQRPHRSLMLRKATTYLPEAQINRLVGNTIR
jgi:3-methyladenine DNA glycosylase AlkD